MVIGEYQIVLRMRISVLKTRMHVNNKIILKSVLMGILVHYVNHVYMNNIIIVVKNTCVNNVINFGNNY